MKLSVQQLALLSLSALGARADYWVAKSSLSTAIPGPVDPSGGNWQFIIPADANDCDSASSAGILNQRSDVSGDKLGIRVKFESQGDDLFEELVPLEVEWNTGSVHQTWYAERNGDVFNLEGGAVGNCVVDFSVNKECDLPAFGKVGVQSMLRCTGDGPA